MSNEIAHPRLVTAVLHEIRENYETEKVYSTISTMIDEKLKPQSQG